MTPAEVVARARSQIGRGTIYRMGGGAHSPYALDCQDETGAADCSVFACWVMGLAKYQPAFGWLNSDGIYRDAHAPVGFFELISAPAVGCVVVYPSAAIARKPGPKTGHVGIVTEISGGKASRVIHCSAGFYKRTGDAIGETDAAVFERVAYSRFAWCATVER